MTTSTPANGGGGRGEPATAGSTQAPGRKDDRGREIDTPIRARIMSHGKHFPVSVRGTFDRRDPFAVKMICSKVDWFIARCLLTQVINDPFCEPGEADLPEHGESVGMGDVVLQREHPALHPEAAGTVRMSLSSPTGAADLYLNLEDLVAFLDEVGDEVSEGDEEIDWDQVIGEGLAGNGGTER